MGDTRTTGGGARRRGLRGTVVRWAGAFAGEDLQRLVDRRVQMALDARDRAARAAPAPASAPVPRPAAVAPAPVAPAPASPDPAGPPRRGTRESVGAHAARPWLATGRSVPTRVQSPELRALRRAHPYTGPVLVQVGTGRPVWMWFDEDDLVAAVSFWFGPNAYESLSTAVFAALAPGAGTVLDVGAHTGIFSLVAAASGPDVVVHAFEVVDRIARRARTNVSLSGLTDRVHVHAVGLSSAPGTMTLHHNTAMPLATGSSFEPIPDRQVAKGAAIAEVEVTTLDAWWEAEGRPHVGLVKMDVERHESHVIAGARELLRAEQPVLLAEVLSRDDFAALYALLAESGYTQAWFVDDDAGRAYPVAPDLTYDTGAEYVYTRYHNVLFVGERHTSAVARAVATLGVAAPAPDDVPVPASSAAQPPP